MFLPQNQRLMVNKDEWGTKEGPKNALYVQWYGKRYLLGWNNAELQKKKLSP